MLLLSINNRRIWLGPAALAAGLVLALASAALAQTPARTATRVDSLRAARHGVPPYVSAVFTFTTGKQVNGFLYTGLGLPTCFLDQVSCYETSPDQIPTPPIKAVSVERLRGMTTEGHRYESLYLKGKPLGLLAENLAAAGPLQIFGYAKTKNDMLIPIPLPVGAFVVSTGTHDKYYWYVRMAAGELLELPRGQKAFVQVMSQLCQKAPALVAELQRSPDAQKPRYRFDNAPDLVREYNAAVGAP